MCQVFIATGKNFISYKDDKPGKKITYQEKFNNFEYRMPNVNLFLSSMKPKYSRNNKLYIGLYR